MEAVAEKVFRCICGSQVSCWGKHRGRGWVQQQTPPHGPACGPDRSTLLTFGAVPMLYHKLGTHLLVFSNTSGQRTHTPSFACLVVRDQPF